ncbi:MAG TPA: hypothetical protein PLH19_10180 [Anaerolineae bacterium]|nr:hypothetical protein [Anaerolineae bacterium]HQH38884.1 hypothetical protein [Anaerolineae bacterium]
MEKAPFPALIPGTPLEPTASLARYRAPTLATFARAAIGAATAPGNLVVELGAGDATYIREALELGRRVLALNVNPIPLLWTQVALNPMPLAEVQAALTRLGDLPKGDQPLIAHIHDVYRSRCPTCHTPGIAEWFAWDRDMQRPFAKRVRCPHCPEAQEGAVDAPDIANAEQFAPRGPAYHIALGRAAGVDDPLRERAAELIALYTPRNLSVLMDVIHRLPQASSSPDIQRILTLFVISALDEGSSLVPYGEPPTRPRSFRPAQRFIENNVWLVMENALRAYGVHPPTPAAPPADTVQTLLESPTEKHLLLAQPFQNVAPTLPPHSIAALLIQPQPPDAIFWALSALWATWLWKEAVHPSLRAFLGRRRLEWDWYRFSLAVTLKRLSPHLKPDASLFVVLPNDDLTALAYIVTATAQAGFGMQRWIACPPWGYRLALTLEHEPAAPPAANHASLAQVLHRRGEPTSVPFLDAVQLITAREAASTQLATLPQKIHTAAFTVIAPQTVWLPAGAGKTAKPLADRVEESVLRLLQFQEQWERTTLESAVYASFHGELSPEPALVAACCDAYATADEQGNLRLRAEDLAAARRAETRQIRGLLRHLGERLNFNVTQTQGWDIIWADGEKPLYLFRCTTTAVLGPHLLTSLPPSGVRRHLVLPGGRAALVALKLKRDPRLQQNLEQDNWSFIKFRHLRRMAAEINQRADIEVYLGLDPIVEQEKVQIPLPWE